MRHFDYIDKEILNEIFYKLPNTVSNDCNVDILEFALGATLYMPATRKNIDQIILEKKFPELSSLVICLEDAIGDQEIETAELNLVEVLDKIDRSIEHHDFDEKALPLLFIRTRNADHLLTLIEKVAKYSQWITGFVFPKFDETNGDAYLKNLDSVNKKFKTRFLCMPILESKNIIFKETRLDTLMYLSKLFTRHKEKIINLRVGATDFSSYFGLRRNRDFTVYDIHVIRDCITDIINIFTRNGESFTISGSVWEYFDNSERILKPRLRASIFEEHLGEEGSVVRGELLRKNLDGFIREILLDKENGMIGKTVIHPSHISIVNSLYVVTKEEYHDAMSILENNECGVLKSVYNNKMNETKPHTNWANKIIKRAKVYGVFNEGSDFVSLLTYRMGGAVD